MCLAIPAKIVQIDEDGLATADFLGVMRSISVDLTPQANEGDFVLVHAGFAIEVVDADYAQETIDLIREFPEIAGLDPAGSNDPATSTPADRQAVDPTPADARTADPLPADARAGGSSPAEPQAADPPLADAQAAGRHSAGSESSQQRFAQ